MLKGRQIQLSVGDANANVRVNLLTLDQVLDAVYFEL